jgi:hypothetical protein
VNDDDLTRRAFQLRDELNALCAAVAPLIADTRCAERQMTVEHARALLAHLPGRHNQRSHGRGGRSAGRASPRSTDTDRKDNDSPRTSQPGADSQDIARWRKGRNVPLGRPGVEREGSLPEFDPENPLAAYGDRLVMHDESEVTRRHLRELEQHMPLGAHRALRDYLAEREGGGIYIGASAVPDLDELSELRTEQPRGWADGSTWMDVAGVYDPKRRVVGAGGGSVRHGSASLVLHESGHALDEALGGRGLASDSSEFRAVHERFELAVRELGSVANPYYVKDGNPSGHRSEAWAEGFAAWARWRDEDPDRFARRILQTFGVPVRDRSEPAMRAAAQAFAAYFSGVIPDARR